jgi:hypothetical protein
MNQQAMSSVPPGGKRFDDKADPAAKQAFRALKNWRRTGESATNRSQGEVREQQHDEEKTITKPRKDETASGNIGLAPGSAPFFVFRSFALL